MIEKEEFRTHENAVRVMKNISTIVRESNDFYSLGKTTQMLLPFTNSQHYVPLSEDLKDLVLLGNIKDNSGMAQLNKAYSYYLADMPDNPASFLAQVNGLAEALRVTTADTAPNVIKLEGIIEKYFRETKRKDND